MAETYSPLLWHNDTFPAVNESNLNRVEVGVKAIDARAARLELGITTPVVVPYATSITLNATQGSFFRCIAAGDVTLDGIVGGTDGQLVTLEVVASGGSRTLSFTGSAAPVTIPPGVAWSGQYRFDSLSSAWRIQVGSLGGGAGGTGTSSPRLVLVNYTAIQVLDASLGDTFRITATGDMTLSDVINGTDSQAITLQIKASGADRTFTIAGTADVVPVNQWWVGDLRYHQPPDAWVLLNSAVVAASTGVGRAPLGTSPLGS